MRSAVKRGALVVVGGHSRGVGKTLLVERFLAAHPGAGWAAIKISAHRHAPDTLCVPLVEQAEEPSPLTQTGRYLLAGASRAFLVRAPDAGLPQAAAFIESLRDAGVNAIVESNRIVRHLHPDVTLFVIDPDTDDWKPSSQDCLRAATAVVFSQALTAGRPPALPGALVRHAERVSIPNVTAAM